MIPLALLFYDSLNLFKVLLQLTCKVREILQGVFLIIAWEVIWSTAVFGWIILQARVLLDGELYFDGLLSRLQTTCLKDAHLHFDHVSVETYVPSTTQIYG